MLAVFKRMKYYWSVTAIDWCKFSLWRYRL